MQFSFVVASQRLLILSEVYARLGLQDLETPNILIIISFYVHCRRLSDLNRFMFWIPCSGSIRTCTFLIFPFYVHCRRPSDLARSDVQKRTFFSASLLSFNTRVPYVKKILC